jgi:hypothetical protein
VPGVRWAAEVCNRPDIAEKFEEQVNLLVRDADAFHRQLCQKPAKAQLSTLEAEVIQPLLNQIQSLYNATIEELKLIEHPLLMAIQHS